VEVSESASGGGYGGREERRDESHLQRVSSLTPPLDGNGLRVAPAVVGVGNVLELVLGPVTVVRKATGAIAAPSLAPVTAAGTAPALVDTSGRGRAPARRRCPERRRPRGTRRAPEVPCTRAGDSPPALLLAAQVGRVADSCSATARFRLFRQHSTGLGSLQEGSPGLFVPGDSAGSTAPTATCAYSACF